MTAKLAAAAGILVLLGVPCAAHRLDEYLQATLLSVGKDEVRASMRLIPGVAVSPLVIWSIDRNGDGVLSAAEQQAYARRVLSDLSLSIDGQPLQPRLVSLAFPRIEEMKEGLGEIHIEFSAALPAGGGKRRLTLENHHQNRIGVYLVNCLAPGDESIQITAQKRNENQSFYELNYMQAGGRPEGLAGRLPGVRTWLGVMGVLLFARLTFVWRRRAS